VLQIIVLGLLMSLMGMASNIVYALAGGAVGNLLGRRPRFLHAQRYVTGAVYLGLGAAAALAGGTRR
jgi:threonine/homoserine/homoserine lactone efflux protein